MHGSQFFHFWSHHPLELRRVQRWHQPCLNYLPFGAAELLVLSASVRGTASRFACTRLFTGTRARLRVQPAIPNLYSCKELLLPSYPPHEKSVKRAHLSSVLKGGTVLLPEMECSDVHPTSMFCLSDQSRRHPNFQQTAQGRSAGPPALLS